MKLHLYAAALLALLCSSSNADSYTYRQLIDKLTDLKSLAVLPLPGEKCQQWSSWDRSSVYDAKSGKYVAWDANGDNAGIIRTEGNKQVLAEMNGPGVIWRIWSAAPSTGHVAIYLDGSDTPVLDMPFVDYFNSKRLPFNYPGLVHEAALGWNNYIPIPFNKSCKIVADPDWGAYYHFTYTTYPKEAELPTFSRELLSSYRVDLTAADYSIRHNLGELAANYGSARNTKSVNVTIPAHKSVTALKLSGSQAICSLKLGTNFTAAELREVTMLIAWDDEQSPSVWCPIGDFFGSAPGLNKYASLPLGVTSTNMYSQWYMPFVKNATLRFTNDGSKPVSVNLQVVTEPLQQPLSQYGRFHAKWHRDAFLPSEPERAIDWPILKTTGTGRFVGVCLNVYNPGGGWWGEGDEKFWVDGEKFPSTFGTGSEDYFGYAWCNPTLFQHAYHNQTLNEQSNAGNISVNRWHITDNIPFQNSYEADIEKYYANDRPTLYSCVTYWYLSADGKDAYTLYPLKERTGYYHFEPYTVAGAVEAETMQVLSVSGGQTSPQPMGTYSGKWSGMNQLWWTGASPGDRLQLAVPVEKPGKYQISMQLTKAIDYAEVQLYLDNKPLNQPMDLFHDGVMPTGQIDCGKQFLAKGQHTLSIEIKGANEKAIKAYMVGLDYITLKAIR